MGCICSRRRQVLVTGCRNKNTYTLLGRSRFRITIVSVATRYGLSRAFASENLPFVPWILGCVFPAGRVSSHSRFLKISIFPCMRRESHPCPAHRRGKFSWSAHIRNSKFARVSSFTCSPASHGSSITILLIHVLLPQIISFRLDCSDVPSLISIPYSVTLLLIH